MGSSTSDKLRSTSSMPTSLWQTECATVSKCPGGIRPTGGDAGCFSVAAMSLDEGKGMESTGPTGTMGSTGSSAVDVDGSEVSRVGQVSGCCAVELCIGTL